MKAAGSTRRTRASRGWGPPHCSSSTRVPGESAAPSRESNSITTSRSLGSPTSRMGVPAVIGLWLSWKTWRTRPALGALTSIREMLLPRAESANSASMERNAPSVVIKSRAAAVSRSWMVSRSCGETVLSANIRVMRPSSLIARACAARLFSRAAVAAKRRVSAKARLRGSRGEAARGSITATMEAAVISAPGLKGTRRNWPVTGEETT